MGDLVVVAAPPVIFSRPSGWEGTLMGTLRFFGWDFGGHGYDPSIPDMGASFLVLGRGASPGADYGEVRQIDVAPTVAHLLGIAPPLASEGRVVQGIATAE